MALITVCFNDGEVMEQFSTAEHDLDKPVHYGVFQYELMHAVMKVVKLEKENPDARG